MKPNPDSNTNGRSSPRFSYTDTPHPDSPALIGWQVWIDGKQVSIDQLVREANRLQRLVDQLQGTNPPSPLKREEPEALRQLNDWLFGE